MGAVIGGAILTIGKLLLTSAITAAITYAVAKTFGLIKRPPELSSTSLADDPSASDTYAWGEIGTVWNVVGKPIPIVYGEHRVGGRRIQEFTRMEGKDDYLYLLMLFGEGEIENITDIKINGEDISSYSEVQYWIRKGTPDQELIPYFNNYVVQNYAIRKTLTTSWQQCYEIEGGDIDELIVRLYFPNGLYRIDKNDGNMYEKSVTVMIAIADSESEIGSVYQSSFTITNKNRSPFYYDAIIPKSAINNKKKVFVLRTNEETTSDYEADRVQTFTVQEIKAGNENYPNCALLGLKIKATNQLYGGSPDVSAVVKGLKVKNLKTGVVEWSNNPAWILYDILTNTRYGAGSFFDTSVIDEQSFKDAADYYDELVNDGKGGQEKRFELNIVIDTFQRINDVIEHLLLTCFSDLYFIDGKIKLIPKKEKTIPAQLFTSGNIIENSMNWTWTSKKEKYNSVEVQFLNEDDDYERYTVIVPFQDISVTEPQKKTNFYGLTKQSQAIRLARLLLRQSQYCDKIITFDAMIDSVHCQPSDLVYIAHKQQEQLQTGNILGFGTDYLILDEDYTFESSVNYDIAFVLEDDTVKETPIVPFSQQTTTNIVKLPFTFASLGKNPKVNSQYTLGLSSETYEEYEIIAIERKTDSTLRITAIKYDDRVWEGIDDFSITDYESYAAISDNKVPKAVENLTLKEQIVINADRPQVNLQVFFSRPEGDIVFDYAKIYFCADYDETSSENVWTYLGDSTGFFEIENVIEGNTVAVKVQSVSVYGYTNDFETAPTASLIVQGFNKVPDDVGGFQAYQQGESVVLKWNFNSDFVTKYYEIRKGTSWDGGEVIASNITSNEYRDFDIYNGTYKYFIKAISYKGIYSENAAEADITIRNIYLRNVIFDDYEAPDWDGIRRNFKIVHNASDNYLLSSHKEIEWENWFKLNEVWTDRVGNVETWGKYQTLATYETTPYDIGKVWECRVIADFDIDFYKNNGKWTDYYYQDTFTWGDRLDYDAYLWAQLEVQNAVQIQVSFSNDMSVWTDWETFKAGIYTFRGIKFKITVQHQHESNYVEVNRLHQILDVDDVIIYIPSFSIAAGGTTITYANYKDTKGRTPDFLYPPFWVSVQLLDASKNLAPIVKNKTTTSLEVIAYNSSDTSESAVADIMIHGY